MSQPFTFPPPPPPPPRRDSNHDSQGHQNLSHRGNGRGRGGGGFRGAPHNSRGGLRFGNQSTYHGSNNNNNNNNNNNSSQNTRSFIRDREQPFVPTNNRNSNNGPPSPYSGTTPSSNNSFRNERFNPPIKRDHAAAFRNTRRDHAHTNHRPRAPPAVPSFGIDIESILPPKPEQIIVKEQPVRASTKQNLLGLTPLVQQDLKEQEAESDDEGEEARLAETATINGLQFEYRGQVSTLRTPEDIAAWVAERRKRFPTHAKAEAAKKEAEEKKQKWEVEKKARQERAREAAQTRQEQRNKWRKEQELAKVRKRLLATQVEKAKKTEDEERGREAGTMKGAVVTEDTDLERLIAEVDQAVEAAKTASDVNDDDADSDEDGSQSAAEDTSTSGSSDSDSDSDSAPEMLTAKRTGPEKLLAFQTQIGDEPKPRICHNFAKFGRCKYGRKCFFAHERKERRSKQANVSGRRKGLYEIMVEKEKEEDLKKVLRAIVSLGEQGLLDDPTSTVESEL